MFGKFKKDRNSKLTEAKDVLLGELLEYDPTDKEYAGIVANLKALNELDPPRKSKVDVNTLLLVGGNLLGILVIVAYEQKHVFATQAKNFLLKVK